MVGDGILLGASAATYGVRYYDIANDALTTVSTTYGNWMAAVAVDDGVLMSSSTSGTGI